MRNEKLVLLATARVVAEKETLTAMKSGHPPVTCESIGKLIAFIDQGLEHIEERFDSFITPRSRSVALRNSLR